MPMVPMIKSAADEILAKYGKKIEELSNDTNIEIIATKIENKAKEMEDIALNAYHLLGFFGSDLKTIEQTVNERIKQLQNETINLNGSRLNDIFLDSFREALGKNKTQELMTQDEYEWFLTYVSQQAGTESREITDELKIAAALLLEEGVVNASTIGNYKVTGRMISSGGKFKYNGNFQPIFAKLSQRLKEKINAWYRDEKNKKITSLFVSPPQITTNDSDEGTQVITRFNADDSPEKYLMIANDEKQRDRFFQENPTAKREILMTFRQKIIDNCPGISRRDLFEQALDEVFFNSWNPDAMFIGGNINNMTGRLGEIQALYYMKVLTNGMSFNMTDDLGYSASWTGGINNPHADVILKNSLEKYGMQVKNTARDISKYTVGFQEFGISSNEGKTAYTAAQDIATRGTSIIGSDYTQGALDSFNNIISSLYGGININTTDVAEGMTTIFSMYGFNIGYAWRTGKNKENGEKRYYKANPSEFADTRSTIERLTEQANRILSLMSVATMYLQGASDMQNDRNTIFLIGGSTIISAASILANIANELRTSVSYKKSSFKFASTNSTTIVDVLNSEKDLSTLKFGLKSSYTFTLNK